MVTDSDGVLRSFYEWSIKEDLDSIRSYQGEFATFARIREAHQDSWQIVEAVREILFENTKAVRFLYRRIRDAKSQFKSVRVRG
jgi:hypothetical protein